MDQFLVLISPAGLDWLPDFVSIPNNVGWNPQRLKILQRFTFGVKELKRQKKRGGGGESGIGNGERGTA